MNVPITVRAYIVRKHQTGYQLLVFNHPDCPEAPIQIPGGGVDPGESLETALYQILEESGLSQLRLIRKLGVAEMCWRSPRKQINQRHFYLLEASPDTPDRWQHQVQGDGMDAGMQFSYYWHRPSREFSLFGDLGYFLYPNHIPELYDSENCFV